MASPIVHFEIPVDNVKRAKAFYEKLFGWKFEEMKGMDYFVIKAKDKDNGIDGGMMKRKMPNQPFLNYIHVKSIDATLKAATGSGAKIMMPKTSIGDMGFIAVITDPEGNAIGIHSVTPAQAKLME